MAFLAPTSRASDLSSGMLWTLLNIILCPGEDPVSETEEKFVRVSLVPNVDLLRKPLLADILDPCSGLKETLWRDFSNLVRL